MQLERKEENRNRERNGRNHGAPALCAVYIRLIDEKRSPEDDKVNFVFFFCGAVVVGWSFFM